MGGFLGIGGSSANTDRSNTLQGFSNLKNVFNYALPTAQSTGAAGASTTAAGTGAIGQSLNYFQKLMSGNRAASQQAIAPVANQGASAADAQRKQLATSGTARGGGTAAVNEEAKTKQTADIDNLLFGAQSGAAKETGELGGKLADVGTRESADAATLLGVGTDAAAALTKNSIDARGEDYNINQNMVANVGSFVQNALGLGADIAAA